MKQWWQELPAGKRWALISIPVVALALVLYAWAASRPGIWYDEYFLYRQEENRWQGEAYGSETTFTRIPAEDGATLLLENETDTRRLQVVGTAENIWEAKIYEDGELIYNGLLSENAVSAMYYVNGVAYDVDTGLPVEPETLEIGMMTAVRLALSLDEDTRGAAFMPLAVLPLLIVFYAEIWWPEWFFRRRIGRFVEEDVNPSERYLLERVIGMIAALGGALVMLAAGFGIGG